MKKKMLLVTHGFPFGESERGFISTEFAELINEFDMSILACGTNGNMKYPIPNSQNINIEIFNYSKRNLFKIILQIFRKDVREDIKRAGKLSPLMLFLHRTKKILSYSFRVESISKEIEKIIKKNKIDMIYTYWGTEELVAALRLKKKYKNIKVITRFHGYDLYTERSDVGWQPFQQYKADHCDRIFFISGAGEEYFTGKWGGEAKSHISYLGTPSLCKVVSFISDELVLISCSNLIELKRVERIIQAISILPENIRIYWHHIGDGPEKTKLHKLAKDLLSQKGNVQWKFWGYIPNKDIEKMYHEINPQLFITTSSSEGLPVSIQEAFAMSIPAIGTDVGGMRELIVNNKTGFLLQADPAIEDISGAINKFYHLPQSKRREMEDKVFQTWCENFDAVENAKKFVRSIKYLL